MQPFPVRIRRGFAGLLFGAALVVTASGAARAHEVWTDGTPIPDWVRKACCGPSEAHHLTPSQVRHVDGAYLIDGYPSRVSDMQALPSQDGEYWAFYSTTVGDGGEKLYTSVFCFFAPAWG